MPQSDDNSYGDMALDPEFARVPTFTTVVPREGHIRGVIFDICGSIIVSMHTLENRYEADKRIYRISRLRLAGHLRNWASPRAPLSLG